MKKLIGISIMFTMSALVNAGVKTRVLHIDSPEIMGESYEVLIAKNREVIKVNPSNTELIKSLFEAEKLNSVVELEITKNRLDSLTVLEEGDDLLDFYTDEDIHPMTNYTPDELDSVDEASKLFKQLTGTPILRKSQCFNRAHFWAKQMHDKNNEFKSMKILIYYTKKFRREISSKWWFHIAPMVSVNGEYYVMDRGFTNKPVTNEAWESIFTKKMKKKGIHGYRCKVIKNISEFYDRYNQQNEYCNIQVTSMYYWEPNDMSRLEKKGTQQTEFKNSVLRASIRGSFFRWRKFYNRYKVQ